MASSNRPSNPSTLHTPIEPPTNYLASGTDSPPPPVPQFPVSAQPAVHNISPVMAGVSSAATQQATSNSPHMPQGYMIPDASSPSSSTPPLPSVPGATFYPPPASPAIQHQNSYYTSAPTSPHHELPASSIEPSYTGGQYYTPITTPTASQPSQQLPTTSLPPSSPPPTSPLPQTPSSATPLDSRYFAVETQYHPPPSTSSPPTMSYPNDPNSFQLQPTTAGAPPPARSPPPPFEYSQAHHASPTHSAPSPFADQAPYGSAAPQSFPSQPAHPQDYNNPQNQQFQHQQQFQPSDFAPPPQQEFAPPPQQPMHQQESGFQPPAPISSPKPAYNPDSANGPNGAGVHAPGQISHPAQRSGNADGVEAYHVGFCDCFGDIGACCTGFWCPCILYSKTYHRLKTIPNSNTNDFSACNSSCAIFCILSPVSWIFTTLQRSRIRENYRLEGGIMGDCCRAYCCVGCTLVQDDREVAFREEQRRKLSGVGPGTVGEQGYKKNTGMNY